MRRRAPVSLRNRISLVLVSVVAVALLGANLAVFTVASGSIDQQVDENLGRLTGLGEALAMAADAGIPVDRGFSTMSFPRRNSAGERVEYEGLTLEGTGGEYVGLVEPDGSRPISFFVDGMEVTEERLRLPEDLAPEAGEPVYFDTSRETGEQKKSYRARAASQRDGTIVVVAVPTAGADADRQALVRLQVVAGLTVLVLLALLARWLVRVGLRPLARMEQTAERIADGDLTHRVEPSGPDTEISRLGEALNRMLGEIEQAFATKEESERRLLASEQRLRRFVADASHEMRTPLTSIGGYAQLLRRDRISDAQEWTDAATRIEDQAARLTSVVDDLLLLARLDNEAPFRSEVVALAPLAGRVVDDARVVDPDRVIGFEADGAPEVRGDPDALTRVITNLVANACRHTPEGSPVELVVRGPDEVVVDVVDHGEGIPEDIRPQLFNRFFRADQSRSRDRGGAGLGLAIVAGVVEAHDGRCEVLDTPGGGATFRVVLPRAVDEPELDGARQQQPSNRAAAS